MDSFIIEKPKISPSELGELMAEVEQRTPETATKPVKDESPDENVKEISTKGKIKSLNLL